MTTKYVSKNMSHYGCGNSGNGSKGGCFYSSWNLKTILSSCPTQNGDRVEK